MDVAFYSKHLKNWVAETRPIMQAERRPDLAVVFRNDEPRREAHYPSGWILLTHDEQFNVFVSRDNARYPRVVRKQAA